MIKAGKLDDRITIQQLTSASPNRTGSGMPDESWTTFTTVYASVEPLSGRELFAAEERHAETTTQIIIRYLEGVTQKMRILGRDGTIYDIDRLLPYKRDGYMELLCKSGVTEG